jgi:hypothetical protein
VSDQQREGRLKKRLAARGFDLRKSAGAAPPANCGKYMVFDPVTGGTLLGHRFEADLDAIEAWLGED